MAELTIDLAAIRANYKILQNKVGESCEVAGVVKADAYGLGVGSVAQTLQKAGCKTFFVATLPEAIELRLILGDGPAIAMLNGYFEGDASLYAENNIAPVINDLAQLKAWQKSGSGLDAILHVDTGMNRLGVRAKEIQDEELNGIKTIMSHFSSSEEPENPTNKKQADQFEAIAQKFPNLKKSLCNSGGIFLDKAYHYDLVRPGMALYGLNPTPYQDKENQSVVRLNAKILQTHEANNGETLGYNETYRMNNNTKLAIVDIGYADGIFRSLSNAGNLYWKDYACPIRGRVSMDLTIVDLCNIPDPEMPQAGESLEVISENQTADDLAKAAGTIGYEILTSLSHRYERKYINP